MRRIRKIFTMLFMCFAIGVVIPAIIPQISTLQEVQAAAIKLNKSKLTINLQNSYTLKVSGTKNKVAWSSSNPKIATVNSKGKVYAKKIGTTTIYATIGKTKLKCIISVENPKLVLPKTLKKYAWGDYFALKGDTLAFSVKGTKNKVTWKTSNKKIATISNKGTVKLKEPGKVIIYSYVNGKELDNVLINVEYPHFSEQELTILVDNTKMIEFEGTLSQVTWKSSNSNILEIVEDTSDNSCYIKGKSLGEAYVIAKLRGKEYRCKVKIVNMLSVEENNITCSGETIVKVKSFDSTCLICDIGDSGILACEYNEFRDTEFDLKIIPKRNGKTTIKLFNDSSDDYITLTVTVTNMTNNSSIFYTDTTFVTCVLPGITTINVTSDSTKGLFVTYPSIAHCRWGKTEGNMHPLIITPMKRGFSYIDIENKDTGELIKVYVHVIQDNQKSWVTNRLAALAALAIDVNAQYFHNVSEAKLLSVEEGTSGHLYIEFMAGNFYYYGEAWLADEPSLVYTTCYYPGLPKNKIMIVETYVLGFVPDYDCMQKLNIANVMNEKLKLKREGNYSITR